MINARLDVRANTYISEVIVLLKMCAPNISHCTSFSQSAIMNKGTFILI